MDTSCEKKIATGKVPTLSSIAGKSGAFFGRARPDLGPSASCSATTFFERSGPRRLGSATAAAAGARAGDGDAGGPADGDFFFVGGRPRFLPEVAAAATASAAGGLL